MSVEIVFGNILDAGINDVTAILHQVNCKGVMGAGLAKEIKKKYPVVYDYYHRLCCDRHYNPPFMISSPLLGRIQVVWPDNHLVGESPQYPAVVNLFAQDGYGRGKRFTDYYALEKCLKEVNKRFHGERVAIPYGMSCGLAGGDWSVVSRLIEENLRDCKVYVYKLTEKQGKE